MAGIDTSYAVGAHPQSRRRRRLFTWGAILFAVLAGLWVWRVSTRPSIKRVERSLASAGIVRGTSVARVLTVLDSLGAVHSDLSRDQEVAARFGVSSRGIVVSSEVFGAFHFDSAGELESWTITEKHTGL